MRKSVYLIIVSIFMFASCATTNIPGVDAYHPAVGSSESYPFNKDGNIIIKRDTGFFGSALDATIFLEDKQLAVLLPGEYFQFLLSPGRYFIRLDSAKEVNLGVPFSRYLKIYVENQNDKYVFRIFPMAGQGMLLEEVFD